MKLTLNLYVAMLVCAIRSLAVRFPQGKYVPPSKTDSSCSSGCYYDIGNVENGPDAKGCIVGQANRELGVLGIELPCYPRSGGADTEIKAIFPEASIGDLDRVSYALAWVRNGVQSAQDDNYTWEQAVKQADLKYPNLPDLLK